MKTDSVWISVLPRDGSNVVTKIEYDPEDPARKAILSGGDPRPEDLPIIAFEAYYDSPIEGLPPLFGGAGGLSFTKEIAEPLLKFDLVRTLILPLRILKYDRKTELFAEGEYYILLRHNVFEALAPDSSTNLRPDKYDPPKRWARPLNLNSLRDGDVAVKRNALDGPPEWHDPALYNGEFFFNGEVVKAMQANDTAKYWNLRRCTIVDD